jgi:hypothetical protein
MRRSTDLTKVIERFKNDWEDMLRKIPEIKDKKIEIKIIDNLKFNASVRFNPNDSDSNIFLVQIYEGVFHKVWNFYHSTFNNNNPSLVKMAGFMDEDFTYTESFANNLANIYVIATLNFVFLHEVGHIVNNHLLYLRDLGYTDPLQMDYQEPENIKGSNISAHEYQMLEIEADQFASRNILEIISREYSVSKALHRPSIFSIAPDLKHLCLYIFSASINERALQGLGANKEKYDLSRDRYVPNRMRLLIILQEFIKTMGKILKDDFYPEELLLQHVEGFESVINMYLVEEGIYDQSVLSIHNNLHELDEEVSKHVNYLMGTIYPDLKKKLDNLS